MNRSFNAYGSTRPPGVIAQVSPYDRLLSVFVLAAMGALLIMWVHLSPFASIAMAR